VIITIKYVEKNISDKENLEEFDSFVMGIDIGGTNTNIGIAGIKTKKLELLFSLSFKTQELDSLIPAILETLNYCKSRYNISISTGCIGAAGVVSASKDFASLTNADWNVEIKEILEKTDLKSVFIINDFQAIGYGINLLDHNNSQDIFKLRKEQSIKTIQTKAILGAGTGLGKSILVFDKQLKAFIPIPSEGGHNDFPAENEFELKLADFVKKLRGISQPLTYEELLSGRGIESIYLFLKENQQFKKSTFTDEIDVASEKTPLISKYKEIDETCKETFKIFIKIYARCAKNLALDALALGGLYLAGGIASKNPEIFTSEEFLIEFENAYQRKDVLEKIPIYVVVNYDVSLYGACFAAMYNLSCEVI
jgi:glucokinase